MHSIGTASKQSGVNIETIRYYERENVLPDAERTASGRRVYTDKDIARMRFIKRCRQLGFSIADIRTLLALSDEEEKSCGTIKAIGEGQLAQVREKINDLRDIEKALIELTVNCGDGQSHCPALKQLFSD